MLCYKCGAIAELTIEDGSAICDTCEEDFQAAMAQIYPYGQCGQCGAEYREVTCPLGTKHIVAFHSEGGCGQWRDYGEVREGECPYGGHPLPPLTPADMEIPF
jgi:hypothetical protein